MQANKCLDVLFVNPNSSAKAYQDLAKTYSAIEPPTWALLLAQACRSNGFKVAILDCDAERLTCDRAILRIKEANPRLVCFVIYGQNPNSGTTNTIGASELAIELKQNEPDYPICFVGSHISALPKEILSLPFVDFVLLNEGVYALQNLLRTDLKNSLHKVKGIGYKQDGYLILNPPERVVPQERMDIDLPGYAWDLLPYQKKPLDLYRAHFWHAEFDHNKRTPFAALYTSLGCRFACDFCMINIINRVDNNDNINASHSKGMRFWSSEFILKEFEKLAGLGVSTIRISDEMFFLDRRYYEPLIQGLIDRDLDLRMWAYSRVDTVRDRALDDFKKAGIGWLALGIEAGNQMVRQEVSKGSFQEINIREVCQTIQSHDINIISNYIFGFPDDNLETMQQTLDLALELNTEMANIYPCQALPGSPMYHIAKQKGWELPDSYEGYAFLSYESFPLRTKYLSAAEVLKFRDNAWQTYFTNEKYLSLIAAKFGEQERKNIEDMASIKLKRRILGD
ncbi:MULTISPECIES: B12-binding domain-containing radical SAM protein [Spirulina sp. CCY15215]|uniref:B12-binding domain-containing radical SAM protein n=1 Tax=Spirulina sp. CCY15215 TaxID=2767591 RepID=UPI001951CDBC|nr:B12-binding domain-containing radical SAM protein [Spirulina major]